ncbi:MAG: DMT family transporter [Acidobacteria bacterium]|nr:DMT family transporter [Acidobacteriota bacterium]
MQNLESPKNQKLIGYLLRLMAVIIWGIDPLVAKYALARFDGYFICALSLFISGLSFLPIVFWKILKNTKSDNQKISYHPLFFIIILFGGLTSFFHFISLNYTIAINTVLFLTFAPVVGLFITLVFLGSQVAYLQRFSDKIKIIAVFLIGCIGASLLITNNSKGVFLQAKNKLLGDFIAFLAMLSDVIATLALIRYRKLSQAFSGSDFMIRRQFILSLVSLPIILPSLLSLSLTSKELAAFLFIGLGTHTAAYYLSYEAYKRLDGLINYLFFNITPVITITLESFLFDLPLSVNLILGTTFTIASSIIAEIVNSQAQNRASITINSEEKLA